MRLSLALALAIGSAYAFSFAADLLLGALVGIYSSTAFLPVITWSGLSAVALLVARAISRRSRWLALPYVAFGFVATLGGVVGSHPHDFAVAGLMFVHAYLLWKTAHHAASQGRGHQQGDPTRSSFPVGEYKINALVEKFEDLREFSAAQYAAFGRQFEGEKSFNAPSVEFLAWQWNLMLGSVNGRLYKIAPYLELPNKTEGSAIAIGVLRHCTEMLGEPVSQRTGLFAWDTTDGNVILQTAEVDGTFAVNIFITSRAVRDFQRTKWGEL